MALFDDFRAAWGAAPSTLTAAQYRANTVPPSHRIGVSYHYPGSQYWTITPASDHARCLTYVRAWQRQHFNQGWNDLGYNAVICQHARAIEGRNIDQKGSHSPGVNWTHYGVQLMVADDAAPTAAMYARAVRLHADLTARSGHSLRAWGHRDDPQASTACPGDHIEAWVKAGGPFATTLSKPISTTPAAPKEDDDMPLNNEDAITIWRADVIPAPWRPTDGNTAWQADTYLRKTYENLESARAQITALTAAVQALAASHGANGDAVVEAVRSEVAKAMQGLEVTLSTKPDA